MYRIMLVDDEENVLKTITKSLGHYQDWVIETYSSPKDAIKRAKNCHFDVVISDFDVSHINGLEFLSKIIELQPNAKRIDLLSYLHDGAVLDELNKTLTYDLAK